MAGSDWPEISHRNGMSYDRAASLLADLKVIAAKQGTLASFAGRLEAIHEKHARKGKFIEWLKELAEQEVKRSMP